MSPRWRFVGSIVGGLFLTTAASAAGQSGLIDKGFGSSGSALIDSGNQAIDTHESIALQSDGKIVVTYASVADGADFVVRRFDANGTPDSGFGSSGVVTTNVGGEDTGMCVAVQPDGKIVVGGATFTSSARLALVRYQSTGAIDSGFGTNGQVKTNLGGGNGAWYFSKCAVLVQGDGKIVLVSTVERGNVTDFAVARYSSTGALDTSFNGNGIVYTDFGGWDIVSSAVLQSDGKIVVAGSAESAEGDDNIALARYTTSGALDTTFGTGGRVVTAVGSNYDWAEALLLLSSGKLLVVGNAEDVAVMARYESTGAPDTTFGVNGVITPSTDVFFTSSAALQADGKIVVGGGGFGAGGPVTVMRFMANGLPDITFGAGGGALPPGSDSVDARSVALQSDGRIVAAGVNYGTTSAIVARYLGGPTAGGAIPDFDGDFKADPTVFRRSTGQWLQRRTTAGSRTNKWGAGADVPVPADYDGDGKSDLAVFRPADGYWWLLFSGTNFTTYRGVGWGTGTDVPVPADYDGDGKADIALYRPSDGYWWILFSESNYTTWRGIGWGSATDVPVPGDFDGDGKADLGLYRPSDGRWWILFSNANYTTWRGIGWGASTDVPVPADYDGDGKHDVAIYRPADGYWWILFSSSDYTTWRGIGWGSDTDIPAPGDYDGDGKAEPAIYRPKDGYWWSLLSTTNYLTWQGVAWGTSSDQPTR